MMNPEVNDKTIMQTSRYDPEKKICNAENIVSVKIYSSELPRHPWMHHGPARNGDPEMNTQ